LTTLIDTALMGRRTGGAIEALVLLSRAQASPGAIPDALAALGRAPALAEPHGYVRIFVDDGAPIAPLLPVLERPNRPAGVSASYIKQLLAAFPTEDDGTKGQPGRMSIRSAPLVEPLTKREREVLQLLAAGHSNTTIAAALTVEVGTVKRHVHS